MAEVRAHRLATVRSCDDPEQHGLRDHIRLVDPDPPACDLRALQLALEVERAPVDPVPRHELGCLRTESVGLFGERRRLRFGEQPTDLLQQFGPDPVFPHNAARHRAQRQGSEVGKGRKMIEDAECVDRSTHVRRPALGRRIDDAGSRHHPGGTPARLPAHHLGRVGGLPTVAHRRVDRDPEPVPEQLGDDVAPAGQFRPHEAADERLFVGTLLALRVSGAVDQVGDLLFDRRPESVARRAEESLPDTVAPLSCRRTAAS